MSALKGIDVSHWDGDIDFHKAKAAGLDFVFIKATQGAEMVDPKFAHNRAGFDGVGVKSGFYHFFTKTQDAVAQAEHFLKTVGSMKGCLLPALDLEKEPAEEKGNFDKLSRDDLVKSAKAWLDTVEKAIGRKPFIYTYPDYANRFRLAEAFHDYPLWYASYAAHLHGPSRWTTIAWQNSDHSGWPGVPVGNNVDSDRFVVPDICKFIL